jgi:hypothetical protein
MLVTISQSASIDVQMQQPPRSRDTAVSFSLSPSARDNWVDDAAGGASVDICGP